MLWKRAIKTAVIISLLISAVLYVFTDHIGPYMLLQPQRIVATEMPEAFLHGIDPADFDLNYEAFSVVSFDNVKMTGYHIRSGQPSARGTIILLHGVGGCKEHMLPLAARLSSWGFNTIIFDQRAHALNDAQYCTYGFYERKDVSVIIDHLLLQDSDQKIGIWGNSMGGAIALLSLSSDPRISAGVVESTFADFHQVVFGYQKRLFGLPSAFISNRVIKNAGELAEFDPKVIKPVEAAKQITQPVFIAHGTADQHIPFEHGNAIFENLSSPQKRFFPVQGAGHYDLWKKAGETYETSIKRFLFEHFPTK
ncbi:MAG: alpha/beta fold hydrolase [Bacteroidota bacterium]